MAWHQRRISVGPLRSGFHLITDAVLSALPELKQCRAGILHIFVQHTSASVTINENADPDVAHDLEMALGELAPEDLPYRHTSEGPDDMPAHIKSALLGSCVTVPITEGRLALGTWQGIYLCEHRQAGGRRHLVLTLWGQDEAQG